MGASQMRFRPISAGHRTDILVSARGVLVVLVSSGALSRELIECGLGTVAFGFRLDGLTQRELLPGDRVRGHRREPGIDAGPSRPESTRRPVADPNRRVPRPTREPPGMDDVSHSGRANWRLPGRSGRGPIPDDAERHPGASGSESLTLASAIYTTRERRVGDLISCQNDGKCPTAIVGKVEIAYVNIP